MNEVKNRFYEFEEFRIDARERVLSKNGEIVALTFKSFDVLLTLVQNSGRLLEKDELMQRVWAEAMVEEANLKNCISALRKALGDSPHQSRFIQTLPKLGYKFVAPVIALPEKEAEIIVEKYTSAEIIIDESEGTVADAIGDSLNRQEAEQRLVVSDPIKVQEQIEVKDALRQPREATNARVATSRKSSLYKTLSALTVVTLCLAVCALGLYTWLKAHKTKSAFGFENMKMARLTDLGSRTSAISADGKYAVYSLNNAIWVKEFNSGNNTQLFTQNRRAVWGLSFSPDNHYLYVVMQSGEDGNGALYKIPISGGTLEKVMEAISSPINFSPDGAHFIFKRGEPEMGRNMLVSAKTDGSEEKIIFPASQRHIVYSYDWAPDGKTVAMVLWNIAEDLSRSWQVVELPATGGDIQPLIPEQKPFIAQVSWLKDKSGLIMVARESMTGPRQLWQVAYPTGEIQRLTNDLNDYEGVNVISNGKALFTVQNTVADSLFVGDASSLNSLSKINIDNNIGKDISWTPDNRIIYGIGEGNKQYLWQMAMDGSEREQLTFDDVNCGQARMSPDGKTIVFLSNRSGRYQVWRMDSDGRNAKQLTNVVNDASGPVFSPDGQWVFYQAWIPAGWTVWKVSVEGGSPLQLTHRDTKSWAISPDGKQMAYCTFDESRKRDFVAIKSTDGGEPVKTLNFPEMETYELITWHKEGLYTLNQGHTEIFLLSLAGAKPKALTNFKTGDNIAFALSPDSKYIAIVRASISHDPVLITNFK